MTQYRLLTTRRFLPLFVTQFFNAFNDNVFKNALVILITYKLAKTIAAEQYFLALTGGIFILPFFLFSATAGQIADKYEKSFIIRCIKFAEIIFMIIGIQGFYTNNLSLLMTTLFFLGCHSTFFGPIKYSILPEHLAKNELIAGNGLIEAGTFIAILIGQILGGTLIVLQHGLLAIAVAVLTIALLGFSSSLFIPKTRRAQPDLKISFNLPKQTAEILRITKLRSEVFYAVIGISWFWFIGATFLTQFPTITKNMLNGSSEIFTLFLCVFSIGIGVGSLLCNWILKGKISTKYVPYSMLAMSIFIFDIFLITHSYSDQNIGTLTLIPFINKLANIRILVDVFLLTLCSGLFIVPLYASIQEHSAEEVRSRVIAGNNIINAIFMVLSSVYIIFFTHLNVSIPQLLLIMGITNALVAWLMRVKL